MAWAHSMELMLDAKELWRLVDGTELKPDVATRPQDSKAWSFDVKQARMWIDRLKLRGSTARPRKLP